MDGMSHPAKTNAPKAMWKIKQEWPSPSRLGPLLSWISIKAIVTCFVRSPPFTAKKTLLFGFLPPWRLRYFAALVGNLWAMAISVEGLLGPARK